MKTTFNKKIPKEIIFLLLLTIAFSFLGFFLIKKIQKNEKEKTITREILIDTVEDSKALGYTGQRKIVADSKGNIFVGYRKNYKDNSEIYVAKIFRDANGTHVSDTTEPIAIIDKNNPQRVPSLAIDSKDTIHTVWYGSDTEKKQDDRQIKYTRKTIANKKWESWRNIAHVSGYNDEELWQEHPMILSGRDNMLYIAWEGKDEQNERQQIKFISSENNGTTWSSWKNVQPTKNNTQSRPVLIQDNSGKLSLFMYSSAGNKNDLQQIQYSTSTDKGDSWTAWQPISDSNFDSRHASAAIDQNGKIHAVWRAKVSPEGPAQIIYRIYSDGKWSDSKIVSPSTNYQFFPSIGAATNGIIYISWTESLDASDFPRDDPSSGLGMVSLIKKGQFQPVIKLSNQSNLLYANVSEKASDEIFIPVLYSEKIDEKKYNIRLKILDGTK